MRLLLAMTGKDQAVWIDALRHAIPGADARVWNEDDRAVADYALVWRPDTRALDARKGLKAIFNMGAGVDALVQLYQQNPQVLPEGVPIYRIEDAGMGQQMVEYATYATLRHFRRFADYETLQRARDWNPLEPRVASEFKVGILGLGSLGAKVAQGLSSFGFDVRGYSRQQKAVEGVRCFAGPDRFEAFLCGLHVLINLLPDTPETRGILKSDAFSHLARSASVVNLARGAHLVEADLLEALASGQVGAAMLDVFNVEPLPESHPFWADRRITVTPHISALTVMHESVAQVASKIADIEKGRAASGRLDLSRGY